MKITLSSRKLIGAIVGAVVVFAVIGTAAAATPGRALASAKARAAAAAHVPATRFHFNNIPVRSALQLIANEGGFNLVVSDSVQGNVSLHLNNVTWEQALDVVLKLKGLEQRGNSTTRSVTASDG